MSRGLIDPWVVIDGYCATLVRHGGDPDVIADRVAFIEKTPRVRGDSADDVIIDPPDRDYNRPYIREGFETQGQDGPDVTSWWISGPKGDGGGDPPADLTYGFDPKSRAWCEGALKLLGYDLPWSDVDPLPKVEDPRKRDPATTPKPGDDLRGPRGGVRMVEAVQWPPDDAAGIVAGRVRYMDGGAKWRTCTLRQWHDWASRDGVEVRRLGGEG